jgi:hypothetical protein
MKVLISFILEAMIICARKSLFVHWKFVIYKYLSPFLLLCTKIITVQGFLLPTWWFKPITRLESLLLFAWVVQFVCYACRFELMLHFMILDLDSALVYLFPWERQISKFSLNGGRVHFIFQNKFHFFRKMGSIHPCVKKFAFFGHSSLFWNLEVWI